MTSRSSRQSGQRIRATVSVCPHEGSMLHEGEAAFRVAAVEILLDHLLDDRPEIPVLIRFAPEDCKACTPSRTGSHTPSRTCRNDGTAPGRGPSAPDVEDDRLPPWREKSLKNRAKVMDQAASPRKEVLRPARMGGIRTEIVNRR